MKVKDSNQSGLMETKKTRRADLLQYKTVFLLVGLNLSLLLCLIAFNWKSTYEIDKEITNAPVEIVVQEEIPITQQEQKPPEVAAPEAPKIISRINLVHREVNLDTEIDPFNTDFDEGAVVDIYEYVEPSGAAEEEVEEEEIFYFVEEMPTFRGGSVDNFHKYVAENLRYPEAASEAGLQGRVQLSFVVETDGSVGKVTILRGVDPLLDREAVRVVQGSPKWSPGKQRGKPVRVSYAIPVVFFLHN